MTGPAASCSATGTGPVTRLSIDAHERGDPAEREPLANASGKEFGRKKFSGGAVRIVDGLGFGPGIENPAAKRGLQPFGREKRHRAIARDMVGAFLIGETDGFDIADQAGGTDAAGRRPQIGYRERAAARARAFFVELLQHELRRQFEKLFARCGPASGLDGTPQHDEILRVLKEVIEVSLGRSGQESVCRGRVETFPRKHTFASLEAFAKRHGKPKSLIAEAAIASFLSPDESDRREAAIAKRLDRIVRVLERLERSNTITLETIALFIRFWLTSTPALPEHSSPAARAKGAERYDRFVEALGRRLSNGSTMLKEVSIESHGAENALRGKDDAGAS
jgi:hypothetical protein